MEQIILDWIINYKCNYRCPYCWFHNQWELLERFDNYPKIEDIIKFCKNIYLKYGSSKVCFSGGEPFLFPEFSELILEIIKYHRIEIMSNLSIEVDDLIKKVNSADLEIVPSFHPLFADLYLFKKNALKLKEKGWIRKISYLAWPPQIPQITYYRDEFTKLGFDFFARPFFGIYNGKKYPYSYTEEEKKSISNSVINSYFEKPPIIDPIITKNKLCYAGNKYILIQPDGKIYRCGSQNTLQPQRLILGDILNENFELFDKPQPCESEECICNEWSFLLVNPI